MESPQSVPGDSPGTFYSSVSRFWIFSAEKFFDQTIRELYSGMSMLVLNISAALLSNQTVPTRRQETPEFLNRQPCK